MIITAPPSLRSLHGNNFYIIPSHTKEKKFNILFKKKFPQIKMKVDLHSAIHFNIIQKGGEGGNPFISDDGGAR